MAVNYDKTESTAWCSLKYCAPIRLLSLAHVHR